MHGHIFLLFGVMKMHLSNKGFSLLEIMIAVAIIGIITAIAVPSYRGYVRKAKQVEAKTMLSGIYTSEIAFALEWRYASQNLQQIGFSAQGDLLYLAGWPKATTVNPTTRNVNVTTPLSWFDGPPTSDVDLTNTHELCKPGAEACLIKLGAKLNVNGNTLDFSLVPSNVGACSIRSAANQADCTSAGGTWVTPIAGIDNQNEFSPVFVITAIGSLGGDVDDVWTISHHKDLKNAQVGL